jgi:hypothetical protein
LFALTLAAASLAQAPPEAIDNSASALLAVPALTPVLVRIEDEISSKTNKMGDRFRITVAEDVRVGDAVVIPVGSTGEGEVIHAARPGAGGKAGELIVVARFVLVGDNQVRLRSFTLGAAGRDKSVDALAASFIAGPFAMFQKGGAVVIPRDTLGMAKTALEFKLPAVAAPVPMPAQLPQPVETKEGGVDESRTD